MPQWLADALLVARYIWPIILAAVLVCGVLIWAERHHDSRTCGLCTPQDAITTATAHGVRPGDTVLVRGQRQVVLTVPTPTSFTVAR